MGTSSEQNETCIGADLDAERARSRAPRDKRLAALPRNYYADFADFPGMAKRMRLDRNALQEDWQERLDAMVGFHKWRIQKEANAQVYILLKDDTACMYTKLLFSDDALREMGRNGETKQFVEQTADLFVPRKPRNEHFARKPMMAIFDLMVDGKIDETKLDGSWVNDWYGNDQWRRSGSVTRLTELVRAALSRTLEGPFLMYINQTTADIRKAAGPKLAKEAEDRWCIVADDPDTIEKMRAANLPVSFYHGPCEYDRELQAYRLPVFSFANVVEVVCKAEPPPPGDKSSPSSLRRRAV